MSATIVVLRRFTGRDVRALLAGCVVEDAIQLTPGPTWIVLEVDLASPVQLGVAHLELKLNPSMQTKTSGNLAAFACEAL